MRVAAIVLGVVLPVAAAGAAELPLKGAYGTPAGCAAIAGAAQMPGEATSFVAAEVREKGLVCTYTTIRDRTTDPAAPAYEVIVFCAEGHGSAVAMTLRLDERPGDRLLVALLEGEGPAGEFPACPAP